MFYAKTVNGLKSLTIFAKKLRRRCSKYDFELQTQFPMLPCVECRLVPLALLIREPLKFFFIEFFVYFLCSFEFYIFCSFLGFRQGIKGPKMVKFWENFFCVLFDSLGYILFQTIVGSSLTLSKCVFYRPEYQDPVFSFSKQKNSLFNKTDPLQPVHRPSIMLLS